MIIYNRKAKYEYEVLEEYDAGIMLIGSEVKAVRGAYCNITEAHIIVVNNEVFVKNFYIQKMGIVHQITKFDENRDKKLLLNSKEIERIKKMVQQKGNTIIPLGLFLKNNVVKMKIAVARGKKNWDKKQAIKERDIDRDMQREKNI